MDYDDGNKKSRHWLCKAISNCRATTWQIGLPDAGNCWRVGRAVNHKLQQMQLICCP